MNINLHRLTLAMAHACLNVNDVCRLSGVSHPAMSKLKAGKTNPKPVTVGKVARALGVPVEYLYGESVVGCDVLLMDGRESWNVPSSNAEVGVNE